MIEEENVRSKKFESDNLEILLPSNLEVENVMVSNSG
jgi:hypothetical protein